MNGHPVVQRQFNPQDCHIIRCTLFRKWLELAEATITDRNVVRGATRVELTAFGVYARSLEGVGVRPGDYLAIKNPKIMEWDGKENAVQMFVGLKLQDLGQRIAVLRGVEDALRVVSSSSSNTVLEEQESNPLESNAPESNPQDSPPKSPPPAQVPVPVPVQAKAGGKIYTKEPNAIENFYA